MQITADTDAVEKVARFPAENPNPVIRVDSSGTVTYANPASATVLACWGCSVGDKAPDDWRVAISACLVTREKIETDVQCGEQIFFLVVVPIAGEGYVNLYGTDVTERRQTRRALEEAKENLERRVAERTAALRATNEVLERIFSTIHVCVVYLDRDFNFIRVNRAYAESCGYPEDYFTGKNHFALYPHAENEQIFREVVRTGRPYVVFEKPFVFPEFPERGTTYWDWSLQPVPGPTGEVAGLIFLLRDTTEQKRSRDRVALYQRRLRQMSSELALSEEQMRRRIAKDLHDQIGQTLAFCRIKLGELLADVGAVFAPRVEEVRKALGEVITATRTLTFELASPVLYEIGLEAAVERLLEDFQRRYGVQTAFQVDGNPGRLTDVIRTTIYASVREFLTNVAKHARAKSVSVRVTHEPGAVQVVVTDDGIGFDPWTISRHDAESSCFGLFSTRERVEYLGGSLDVSSAPATGTAVTVRLRTGNGPRGQNGS